MARVAESSVAEDASHLGVCPAALFVINRLVFFQLQNSLP